MKTCPACGKVNEDDKNFCPVCGTELKTASPQPTNTIDEINLVNTRLRSVPQKPKSNAKYGIIIGALCAIIVIMIVVIVCVVTGSKPKSQLTPDYNTPIDEQIVITIDEERYYRPQSEKRFPDIIRFANNCVYLEFGFQEALYYGKADYTVSGNTITLGSVDLDKFKAGGEIVIIGENPNFPEVHIMDEGAQLEYNDSAITIIDFESHWVLEDPYFEYPEEYKDGAVHYLTDDPEKETEAQENIYFQNNTKPTLATNVNTDSNSTVGFKLKAGEEKYFADLDFDHGCLIIDSNYVYIDLNTLDSIEFARARYTVSGDTITLGSMDTYKAISGEIASTQGISDRFYSYHILNAGAKLRCVGETITIIDFERYWVADDMYSYPSPYKNGNKLTSCYSPIFEEFRINYQNPQQTPPKETDIITTSEVISTQVATISEETEQYSHTKTTVISDDTVGF